MKIPLRISLLLHLFFPFCPPLTACCATALLLSVDRNSAYDARLCCIREREKEGEEERCEGRPGTRLLLRLLSDPIVVYRIASRQQHQHHRTHTTRPAHEKAKMLLTTCPFSLLLFFLRVRVFLETRRADERESGWWVGGWGGDRSLSCAPKLKCAEGRSRVGGDEQQRATMLLPGYQFFPLSPMYRKGISDSILFLFFLILKCCSLYFL